MSLVVIQSRIIVYTIADKKYRQESSVLQVVIAAAAVSVIDSSHPRR